MNIQLGPLAKVVSRAGLYIQKYSPEILMGVGVAGSIAANVLTAKSTLKLENELDDFRADLAELKQSVKLIEESPDVEEKYAEKDYKIDLTRIYIRRSARIAKLYAPTIIVGSLSVAALLSSHKIMRDRNIALMAAYQTVYSAYNNYREKIRKDLGIEEDRKYAYGIEEKEVENREEKDGKEVVTKINAKFAKSPGDFSPYARWFNDTSMQWRNNQLHNLTYLRAQQSYFNDMLRVNGHVFLNEVYDALGIPRTREGSVVGWIMDKNQENYVDFGIYDEFSPGAQDFVNGFVNEVLLDFNVDGVIFDKLGD